MREWCAARLGDLVSIVGGGTPARANPAYYGGQIPWVTPKDMKSHYINKSLVMLTQSGLDNSAARLIPANSILIVVRSGVLKHTVPVGVNTVPVSINQDMKALLCSEWIEPKFLARFVKARSTEILRWVRATTADNFPIDKLREITVPVPSIGEQRRIAEVLERAEVLAAKRHEVLARLNDLTHAIFVDMFGDPASNPKGWPTASIGEVARIQTGLQVTSARKSRPIEVPYLRVANVYRQNLDLSEIKLMRVSEGELSRTRLRRGDLLIVEGHGNAAEVGRSSLWDGSVEDCVHQNHLIRARFDGEFIHPTYASAYLNAPSGNRYLLKSAKTTSGLNTINVSNVRGAPIRLPPLRLQREFARQIDAVDGLKVIHRAHLGELDALFASLQYRAFRGEL